MSSLQNLSPTNPFDQTSENDSKKEYIRKLYFHVMRIHHKHDELDNWSRLTVKVFCHSYTDYFDEYAYIV